MTRILHTGDWQLGCKLLQAGRRATEARAKRLDAVEAIVELAHDQEVDIVLVAGDTFEDHDVDDRTVRQAVRCLDELAPIPTYVLPGNHDPLVPGGVWDRSSWRQVGDHVTLLDEAAPVEAVDGLTLYPCPLTQKRSTQDPTAWIPPRADADGLRVGVAHGALDVLPETGNFPIAADRAERSGLDFLALGDWHGLMIRDRTAYPGTHEPTSYSEQDPGHVIVVDLDGAGDDPQITPHRVGQLTWHEERAAIHDTTDVERLAEAIEDAGPPDSMLLRVRVELVGSSQPEALGALTGLRQELEDQVFLLDWEVDEAAFHSQRPVALPEGVLTRADEDLSTVLEGKIPEGPGQAVASEDPEVLREARSLLHRLARRELP